MVRYEVNLEIDSAIIDDYLLWLKPHIRKLLALEGFIKADLFFNKVQDKPARKKITVAYLIRDYKDYQNYIEHYGATMRQDGLIRFEGRFQVDRRILELEESFYG